MKSKCWTIAISLSVLLAFSFLACEKDKEAKKDEPAAASAGEKAAPAKGEPAKAAPAKAEPAKAAAGGGACDAYAKCCDAYVAALGKVQGMPAQALDGAKQGCAQVTSLKAAGAGADAACTQALAAMKQGAAAYKAMPGFVMPDACK